VCPPRRRALQESLPASARSALHLQAGQALAAAGAPVERVARHLLAGPALDARILHRLAGSALRASGPARRASWPARCGWGSRYPGSIARLRR
jgi:hypothetical protein